MGYLIWGVKASLEGYKLSNNSAGDPKKVVEEDKLEYYLAHGCVLAKVWLEYGEEKIGRLYCHMNVAKYMGYNPNYKLIHTKPFRMKTLM